MKDDRIHFCCLCAAVLAASGGGLARAQETRAIAVEAQLNQIEESQLKPTNATTPSSGKNPLILDALDLRDMDVNDVLKLIASKIGLNVIAGKNVQGRVTIYLQNVEVHDALHIILEANDLAYVESRGIIQVMPAADFEHIYGFQFGQVTERKLIQLKGMKAAEAVVMLNQFKSTVGKVVADESSNSLIIEELPAKLKDMEQFIAGIDAPIETRMYELKNVQADMLAARVQEILTSKLGTIRFDGPSNKIFVKDTIPKLNEVEMLVHQLDVPKRTDVFELSYAKAEETSKMLSSMLTKDIGHVEFDPRGNKLVVTDIAPKMAEIAKVIRALDRKDKEVLIEARIVQVSLSDKFKLGVNWEAIVRKWHKLDFVNDFSLGLTSPKGSMSIGTIDNDDYKVVVEALNLSGKTRVLSNPSIAVVNNQEAKILVGTTKPYVTTTTTTPASGPTSVSESVSFIDVGVKLAVTPTIHEDGYITIKIKPEVSSAATSITTGTKNEIPIVDTSTVETTIRVKDGVTIILGGLIKDERTNNKSKFPLLGDIPWVGRVFRSDNQGLDKTEIMIFLTPHIMTGDAQSTQANPALLRGDKIYTDKPLP